MTTQELQDYVYTLPDYPLWVKTIGDYNPSLGYAGPESSKALSFFIPETAWGIDLNPAFYIHDARYAIGGKKKDRWAADVAMLATGLFIIENWPDRWYLIGGNWARRHLARLRLIKYFEAVRAGGNKHFLYR